MDGACADRLPSSNSYHLRVGQSLVGGVSVPAAALICFRQAGTLDPPTCTTANEARAGKAPASTSAITVAALTQGPGLDFFVSLDGALLATASGALSRGGSIRAGALCVGIVVHSTGPRDDSITVFLDP